MSIDAKQASAMHATGRSKSGRDTTFDATGFHDGSARTVLVTTTAASGKVGVRLFADATANTIYVHADDNGRIVRVAFTALDRRDEARITVWKDDASDPTSFRYSVPVLVKTQSLKKAILDGKDELFAGLVGTQPYTAVQEEYEPLLATNANYVRFLDDTDPDESALPAIPGWCIAIYCIPIIGIAGLAIKRCRA